MTVSSDSTIKKLLLLFLIFAALFYAKAFLIPLTFGAILSMLFLPVCRWFEDKGINKVLSALFCVLIFLLSVALIVALLSWQISDMASDATQIEQKATQAINKLKQFINAKFGISQQQQKQILESQQSAGGGGIVASIANTLMSMVVDGILVLVYIFLFIYYRSHIKTSILKMAAPEQKTETRKIISDASKVSQEYLSGLAMMIVVLWIMYAIGFSIAGVKNAFLFAILCGLLEIVPFIGNLTGTGLTLLMSLAQGGGTGIVMGILITYAIVQFLQTYILEPLVVGSQVKINPLFTIIALVVGELIWGIPGMILAIPLTGVAKIFCDHVEALKPYGFLIGEVKKKEKDSGFIKKIKGWFK